MRCRRHGRRWLRILGVGGRRCRRCRLCLRCQRVRRWDWVDLELRCLLGADPNRARNSNRLLHSPAKELKVRVKMDSSNRDNKRPAPHKRRSRQAKRLGSLPSPRKLLCPKKHLKSMPLSLRMLRVQHQRLLLNHKRRLDRELQHLHPSLKPLRPSQLRNRK